MGDAELPFLEVAPADNTTVATLTVTAPNGTSTSVAVSPDVLVPIPDTSPVEYTQTWTADQPVEYSAAGRWVLRWAVSGTGEGAEDFEVYVVQSATSGGPTWWPGRSRVANYVPHRTLQRSLSTSQSSEDVYEMSFGTDTTPTGLQVDRLIADGAAWVSARAAPLADSMGPAASVVVALYAAAAIERGYPDDDQSLQRANDLEKRLDVMLKDLIDANNASNGTDDFGLEVAPMWQFPPADCRWDYSTYW
ncbi:hypothetical protein [Paractinoplanes toevensis]|uniref:hypothetical protein n=1 Tax=Paractinoplanes toevensis TaxID=571911 RepID=UPI001BB33903|nr:hypothetical protein [Actinoplanes toevensis]